MKDHFRVLMAKLHAHHTIKAKLLEPGDTPVPKPLTQSHGKETWLGPRGRFKVIGSAVKSGTGFNDQLQLLIALLWIQLEQQGLGIQVIYIL